MHMPVRKYTIDLSAEERDLLHRIITAGTSAARTIMRANILLSSDVHASQNHTTAEIAEMLQTTKTTIQNVRKSYAENGLEYAINRKKRSTPPVPAKIDGTIEAHIIALCCSQPPEGYARWSVRLLADKCVELGFIESISHMTICRTLKKMNLSLT
jgi:transposase